MQAFIKGAPMVAIRSASAAVVASMFLALAGCGGGGGGSSGGGGIAGGAGGAGGGPGPTRAPPACDPMATCSTAGGVPKCVCPAGMEDANGANGGGKVCRDRNECAATPSPCNAN